MKKYSDKLKHPKWQKKRLEIMERDGFKCTICYDAENSLNVHHYEYKKGCEPWDYENSNFTTLCESCHKKIHFILDDLKKSDISVLKIVSVISFIGNVRLWIAIYKTGSIYNTTSYAEQMPGIPQLLITLSEKFINSVYNEINILKDGGK